MRNKQIVFIDEYLKDFNATQAARRAGYSVRTARAIGAENLTKPDIKAEIERLISERVMGKEEVLQRLAEQARGDLGVFFKIIEEWTFYPLPSHEIIGEKEVEETDENGKPNGTKRINYWVRHVALDMDKVIDPRYSHLIKRFVDSPKNGLRIELHDKQNALALLGKYHRLFVERTSHEDPDGRALGTAAEELAAALRKEYSDDAAKD